MGETTDHSWHPQSLISLAKEPPAPPTIGGLVYPGKRTLLSGETESLKTWVALILAKAEMDIGIPVAWVDVDAMGSDELLSRLRELGVADETIDRLFIYYSPSEALVGERLESVLRHVWFMSVRLVVIDAFNGILNLHGLDPNSNPDIESFWREVAQPICELGAAPVLLDHVVKNPESRGKYAYGSERKASGAHVHVGFKILQEFQRGGTGRTSLSTRKDRSGFLPRPSIGILELVSNGEAVSYSLISDRSHSGDKFRPTLLMERVSDHLASQAEPVSKRSIEENVNGKSEAKRTAIRVLLEEGYAREAKGPHNAKLIEFVRPYRAADDEPAETDESSSSASPVRPLCVPTLRSTPPSECVPASLPMGDADALTSRVRPPARPKCVPGANYAQREQAWFPDG